MDAKAGGTAKSTRLTQTSRPWRLQSPSHAPACPLTQMQQRIGSNLPPEIRRRVSGSSAVSHWLSTDWWNAVSVPQSACWAEGPTVCTLVAKAGLELANGALVNHLCRCCMSAVTDGCINSCCSHLKLSLLCWLLVFAVLFRFSFHRLREMRFVAGGLPNPVRPARPSLRLNSRPGLCHSSFLHCSC